LAVSITHTFGFTVFSWLVGFGLLSLGVSSAVTALGAWRCGERLILLAMIPVFTGALVGLATLAANYTGVLGQ
jgi:hypothetical protein